MPFRPLETPTPTGFRPIETDINADELIIGNFFIKNPPTPIETPTPTGFRPIETDINADELIIGNFFIKNPPTPIFPNAVITSNLQTNVGSPYNADGLDIWAPEGTEIRIPFEGIVLSVIDGAGERDRSKGDFGNQIVIQDSLGNEHKLSHLKKGIKVKPGDKVGQFENLATIGNSGRVLGPTGIHLDWEIKDNAGNNMDINAIKTFYEERLPDEKFDRFEADQLDIENYFEIMKELDPAISRKVDRGFLIGAGGKLKERWEAIKELPDDLKQGIIDLASISSPESRELADITAEAPDRVGGPLGELASNLITFLAIDLPKNLGEGFGKFEAGAFKNDQELMEAGAKQGLSAISGGLGLVAKIPAQFVGGTISGTQEALEEGFGPREALGRGIVTGLERGTLIGLLNRFLFKPKATKEVKVAREAGISEKDIRRLAKQGEITEKEARALLEQQKKAVIEPETKTALGIPDEQLQIFLTESENIIVRIGKQIGAKVRVLKFQRQFIDMTPFRKQLIKDLKGLQIKTNLVDDAGNLLDDAFRDSKVEFSTGHIKPPDQAAINELWKFTGRTDVNPSALEAFQSRVGNKLFKSTRVGADPITQAKRPIEIQRELADKTVSNLSPQLKILKSDFSALRRLREELIKKIGTEGVKGMGLIRKIFSVTGSAEANALLTKVENAAKQFKIKAAQNIRAQAQKAKALETIIKEPVPITKGAPKIRGKAEEIAKATALAQVAPFAARARFVSTIVPPKVGKALIGVQEQQTAAAAGLLQRATRPGRIRIEPESLVQRVLNKILPGLGKAAPVAQIGTAAAVSQPQVGTGRQPAPPTVQPPAPPAGGLRGLLGRTSIPQIAKGTGSLLKRAFGF